MFQVAVVFCLMVAAAAQAADPVIMRLVPDGARFQYVPRDDGSNQVHLVDTWVKVSDLGREGRFNAEARTRYHLFTRQNQQTSQVLINNNAASLRNSNYRNTRRTVFLIHGWLGGPTLGSNTVLVPAYLAGADVNVIVVDWSDGSHWGPNGVAVGRACANFINWMNRETGSNPGQYHIIGFSVGGHVAGIVGRHVSGTVDYITGLDPAVRWEANELFRPNDGRYTEVIHTSAGVNGWLEPLAQVDWYPNGGRNMPGCLLSVVCDHERSYHYMGESLRTGGFTGRRCNTWRDAQLGNCNLAGSLRMGGITAKHGSTGIWWLRTNSNNPFSLG